MMGSMQPIKPMVTASPLYCLPYDRPLEPIALFAFCANVSYDNSLIVFARNGRCQEGRRGGRLQKLRFADDEVQNMQLKSHFFWIDLHHQKLNRYVCGDV